MKDQQIESIIWSIIEFLKKWNLWESVEIIGGQKSYSDINGDNNVAILKRGVYITSSVEMIFPQWFNLNKKPIFIINYEGAMLRDFFINKKYFANISKISKEVLYNILKIEGLKINDINCFKNMPLLDKTEFQNYDEYVNMEKSLEEEVLRETEGFFCSDRTVEVIIGELNLLCQQNNIRIDPIDDFCGLAWEILNE